MTIYLPSLLDKFKDFVNGLKANWEDYVDHVAATAEDDVHGLAARVIISFGSYSNGSYVRWSNGTQVCWAEVKSIYSSSSYVSVTWTYPKPFYSEPDFVGATLISPNLRGSTALTNLDLGPPFIRNSSGTSVTIRVAALGGKSWGEGDEIYLKVEAKGRWKA